MVFPAGLKNQAWQLAKDNNPFPTNKNEAWNRVKSIPKLSYFLNDLFHAFDPKAQKQLVDQYEASKKLTLDIKCGSSFEDYAQKRIAGSGGFAKVVLPDGTELGKKLESDTAATAAANTNVKAGLAEALVLAPEAEQARKDYKEDIATLQQVLKDNPTSYDAKSVSSYLLVLKGEAKQAIETQHKVEKDNLNAKFAEPNFVQDLKTSLNLDNPAQVEAVKASMISALEKSHKEELGKLEKSIAETVVSVHSADKAEFDRIAFLADRYNRDEKMRKIMDEWAANHAAEIEAEKRRLDPNYVAAPSVSTGGKLDDDKFAAMKLDIFDEITTTAGRVIKIDAEHSKYSMTLNRFWQSDATLYEDLTSNAQAWKAAGNDKIRMTISNPDPKRAEEDARKAYESCIKAGFAPKDITIRIGDEVKASYNPKTKEFKNELFKDHSKRLKAAHEEAEGIKAKRDAYSSQPTDKTPADVAKIKEAAASLKAAVKDIRDSNPANTPAPTGPTTAAPTFTG